MLWIQINLTWIEAQMTKDWTDFQNEISSFFYRMYFTFMKHF